MESWCEKAEHLSVRQELTLNILWFPTNVLKRRLASGGHSHPDFALFARRACGGMLCREHFWDGSPQ